MIKKEGMTFKEFKELLDNKKRVYEVSVSTECDDNGKPFCDCFVIDTQAKYLPIKYNLKNNNQFHYFEDLSNSNISPILKSLRDLFGTDIKIITYAKDYYSSKECQVEEGHTILYDHGDNCCISDFDCSYVIGTNKPIKKFPEQIGNFKIYVNEFNGEIITEN